MVPATSFTYHGLPTHILHLPLSPHPYPPPTTVSPPISSTYHGLPTHILHPPLSSHPYPPPTTVSPPISSTYHCLPPLINPFVSRPLTSAASPRGFKSHRFLVFPLVPPSFPPISHQFRSPVCHWFPALRPRGAPRHRSKVQERGLRAY